MNMELIERRVRLSVWIDAVRDSVIGLTIMAGLFLALTQVGGL